MFRESYAILKFFILCDLYFKEKIAEQWTNPERKTIENTFLSTSYY